MMRSLCKKPGSVTQCAASWSAPINQLVDNICRRELTEDIGACIGANDEGAAHRQDGHGNRDGQSDSPPKGQVRQAVDEIAEVEEEGKFHGKDCDP